MKPFEQVSPAEIREFCDLHGATYLFDTVIMFDRGNLKDLFNRAELPSRGRRAELYSETDMPLSLGVQTGAQVRLELEVDPTVMPKDRAARMLDQFVRLLASMSEATPETLLRDLDMLGDTARDELLDLGTPAQSVGYVDFLDRFREVAARNPDAFAIQSVGEQSSLSYRALDSRSDRLAARLQSRGAGPGEIVAIHLGRSCDYVVSLLAVLKTGAAFLPVDPSYPRAVIDHMLTDSKARLVVSPEVEALVSGAEVVAPDVATEDATLHKVAREPGGPAYVIYTSGSTGKPKGVVIPDRAMVGHILAASRQLGLTAEDRVYQFMSLSFDFSLEEILPTISNGATLVLRSDDAAGSAPDFLAEISTLSLTHLNLPTAFFNVVTDYLKASGGTVPDTVRLVNFGGERANPDTVKDWLRLFPNVSLLNGYGPTETAVSCTFYQPDNALPEGDIPIGRATDHATCYVVAPDGSLAPRGAIGELWVGGVAVGLGYLGLPERTAEVFIHDHFRGRGRVYRTGDRVSWRSDGNLDFFGRNDRQVKMRGFRIDLGHVERVLERAQPNLRVVAGVRDSNTSSARLLAWAMTPEKGSPVDIDALNAAALEELPPAMRPRIVEVDDFPRTAGGKVNLAVLPDPGQPTAPVASDVPMSELERQIAGQMSQVLNIADVGAEDDFYDLGGHSLLAAELVGRVETNLGHRISVIDLQQHPNARGLASVVQRGSTGPRHIVPIQPNGSKPPLFGVHILGGLESYYKALAEELGPDQPVLGVTVGALACDKPFGVKETAHRYFKEIQEFHPDGPVHLAAVSLGAYFAWELAHLLHGAGREIGHFALFDANGPGGRGKASGLGRIAANVRTVRHRGYSSIPTAIYNRIQDYRHARIASRMKQQEASGTGIEIRDGNDFIASNDLAVKSYEPKPLAVPFTIYRSAENFFDTEACIKSGLGWEEVATKGCKVVDVPGGHLTMLDPPHVKVLAGHMSRAMVDG